MKKIIVIIIIGMVLVNINSNNQEVIIPKEAIRFRVIANSNNIQDQEVKVAVRNDIQKYLYEDLSSASNLEEARLSVNENMVKYEETVKSSLESINSNESYKINYGQNYFPEKKYKGVTYPAGNYESLVVTLGNGLGDNWWCVLFPPLCLLEAEETEEKEEVEYKFFIKEIIDKYFN